MTRTEIGTSIFLIAFDETSQWANRLIAITLSNYFAAIYRGKLEIKIGSIEITKDTISRLYDSFNELLNSLEDEEEIFKFTSSKDFFQTLKSEVTNLEIKVEEKQLPILGKTAVRIIVKENMPNEYAVIRGGMLITTSLPGLKKFPNYKDFVAVVQCLNPEGEKLLRRMEPARHDAFEPDQFEGEKDQKNARLALKQLQQHIRESNKKHAKDSAGEAGAIDFLSTFLADDAESGADKEECELDPLGKVIITPKPIKTKVKTMPNPGESIGGGGSNGEGGAGESGTGFGGIDGGDGSSNVGGGGGGYSKGKGDGDGDDGKGGKGKDMSTSYIKIKEIRIFKVGDIFKISLTPEASRKVRLDIYAIGQDIEEKISVIKSSIGLIDDGGIVVSLSKNTRIQMDVSLERDSLGSYRIYAEEISL